VQVTLRSIFLTSDTPAELAEFYKRIACLPLETVGQPGEYLYWRLEQNGVQLAIHDAQAFAAYCHPPRPNSNLTHLYFHIDDQAAFLAHLDTHGLKPLSFDEFTVTVADPDGRKLLFGTV